jgi:hypothetical protein
MLLSTILAALGVLGCASAARVSTDGRCGNVRGKQVTCLNSSFGSCCSQHGRYYRRKGKRNTRLTSWFFRMVWVISCILHSWLSICLWKLWWCSTFKHAPKHHFPLRTHFWNTCISATSEERSLWTRFRRTYMSRERMGRLLQSVLICEQPVRHVTDKRAVLIFE